jgi:hypothetical protein
VVDRLLARTRIRLAQLHPELLDFGTTFLCPELGDCGLRHRIAAPALSTSSARASSTIPVSGKWSTQSAPAALRRRKIIAYTGIRSARRKIQIVPM